MTSRNRPTSISGSPATPCRISVTSETAEGLFERGRNFLEEGNTLSALACFEKSYSIRKISGIQSYLGLCQALERGRFGEGFALCLEAISEDKENPVHYLHLGRIYLKAGERNAAIETLRKGLSFGNDPEIVRFLDSIGTRRNPVFPFLSRKNILNKYAGLMLRKLRIR